MNNNPYVSDNDGSVNEAAIYRDAWRIADPGACNPVAVAGTLARASSALLHQIGTDGVLKHPALKVMAGQLSALYRVGILGAELEDYDKVKKVVDSLDLGDDLDVAITAANADMLNEADRG
jgi:hypothetical protein